MSSRQRAAFLGAALLVVVIAVIVAVASGGDSSNGSTSTQAAPPAQTTATAPGTTPARTTAAAPPEDVIVVKGGKPQGGVKTLTFKKGGRIRFTVRSDVSDEVHFHGYDVHRDVKAGGTAKFDVPATIDGRFVVELEGRATEIARVDVQP